MRVVFSFILVMFINVVCISQTIYKTPSGSKYHTSSCRYVRNVSEAMSISAAKQKGLSACSQCNPHSGSLQGGSSKGLGIRAGEARGVKSQASQCRGKTKKGARCLRNTRNVNGYCFQHE